MTTDEPAQWRILDRYRVLGELGRGAMGIVYKVHDDRLDRVIALKTIRKDRFVVADQPLEELLDRFRREARAAGKLSHPGVVTIYDISEQGDDLYIAMEFVAGEPLSQRMRATPRMSVAEAARIGMRLCEALDYAHAHGVIHRDVKPDNIMCCANGVVKLTDFGIARIVSGSATQTRRLMGTPRYMAPEQWRGDLVDGRADVYAVGIVLYELLTGGPTFFTESPSELRDLVLHHEPVPPAAVNPALPPAIDAVVGRAIAREPADRYATASELARALVPFAAAFEAPSDEREEALDAGESRFEEVTVSQTTLPRAEAGRVTSRLVALATALGAFALTFTVVWWAMQPRRTLPMPPVIAVATVAPVAPVAVAGLEEPPRVVVEPTVSIEATASVATITPAAPTAEIASAYRQAGATLADPEQPDATKLAVVDTLASDSSDAATDLLLASTRNPSILVSMAAVKALAGRACARIVEPLTELLRDEEWQRRAWAAKILGGEGCAGARDALAARRGLETDARVAKLVDDAIRMLDGKGADR